jgi:acylphosphatase
MVCFRVLISGRVQGVGYRYSTREKAKALGIVGWVRNLRNGQVEALIVGDRTQVDQLLTWFHQGPPSAKVTAVAVEERPAQPFESFEIQR